jgi:HlyD family secretion protein
VETILSLFQGRATLIELLPEGTQVRKGDVLARLDASQLETDLVKLGSELARSEAALDALENAEIPLEKRDVAVQRLELQNLIDTENQILTDTRELADRRLISPREIDQQTVKLAHLAAKQVQLDQREKLSAEHLYPAKLAQARANLDAARQQVLLAQRQSSNCVITAPADGLVVYLPLHVGNEFRPLRVGDSLYPNQPFLCLPDMREFTAQGFIPESDLALVQPGKTAIITPLAYPDCRLNGTVETLGAMAQPQPGYPLWQKFFRVVIRLDGLDARLRPGMSLHMEVNAVDRPNTVLIPRAAVRWDQGAPSCEVRTAGGRAAPRPLKLGPGNARWFEVLEGVNPGDQVVLP